MAEQRRDYKAYLLRLWRVSSEGKTAWRASLESARTGQRKGFTSLGDLFRFLRQQTDTSSGSDESATESESTYESGY
jgi:hypothetical protein